MPPPAERGFVRFQAPVANARGHHPGIFGLANGLARQGLLSPTEWQFWRQNNDWYQANIIDPSTVDATVYDRQLNPLAAAWFRASSDQLLNRVEGYRRILAAHQLACVRLHSDDPGRVIYSDADQVVVVPYG
ncbi:MAG: hypothetical protein M3Y42_18625 [Actinomycetota bacterium]|nr:hypothetical protein [Actinomycetota bacterium]MDQ2958960.1 hypothetical protein [Actinomycetota bacterium]